jgi:uncharacterized protein (TIGR03435 family)
VVLRAFGGVFDTQIAGAPDWLRTETDDIRQKYLQNLLAERCGLVFHREARELRARVGADNES